jgi:hypothetical protein
MSSVTFRYRPRYWRGMLLMFSLDFRCTSFYDSFKRQYKTSLTKSLDLWYLKDPLSPPNCCPNERTKIRLAAHIPKPHWRISKPRCLQCWRSPDVSVDLEEVTLLMRKTDLALFVEACLLEVRRKPAVVSIQHWR